MELEKPEEQCLGMVGLAAISFCYIPMTGSITLFYINFLSHVGCLTYFLYNL